MTGRAVAAAPRTRQAAGSKPVMVAALGGRGTGKSAWARGMVRKGKVPRLLVWDLMQEHGDMGQPTQSLGEAIRAMKRKRFAVVFWPSRDEKARALQFDLFCRAALAAGDLLLYVEEMAFVTSPYKAPAGWREVCLLGRHDMHRVSVLATSQRPSQVDKEFMGNVDVVHCGRLAHRGDAEAAADLLGVRPEELQRLPDLAWIERAAGDLEPRRGILKFATRGNAAGAEAGPPIGGPPKAAKLRRGQGGPDSRGQLQDNREAPTDEPPEETPR